MPIVPCVLVTFLIAAGAYGQPVADVHGKGEYVEANGARLWYETIGNGPPIVVIAGGPGSSHLSFHPHFSELGDEFQIVFYDAFGRGKSDRADSSDEYSLTRDQEDLEALREALGIDTWSVYGYSYGGVVAQAYALRYPSAVDNLILVSALHSAEMWQAANDYYNQTYQNQFPEEWEVIRTVRSKGFRSSDPEHDDVYGLPTGIFYYYDASNSGKLADKDYPHWNSAVYYAIAGKDANFWIGGDLTDFDFRSQLKNLTMPTLIMHGRYDRVAFPKYALQFRQYAPQAEFVMFEKSGHSPFREETEEHHSILRRFLKQQGLD